MSDEAAGPVGDAPARLGGLPEIGLGGGCHWCTEAVFAALRGVRDVRQGYIRAHPPDDSWSEAVLLAWEPETIALEVLVEIHLRTHSSTSNHKMRGKYRSAIYTTGPDQEAEVAAILDALHRREGADYVTRLLPLAGFKPSDARFRRYGERNAGNQFCTRYIDPKLARLRASHSEYLRPDGRSAG